MNATLTKVRANTYRINHPATNAALTRSKGRPSSKLRERLLRAIEVHPDDELGMMDIEFRKGLKSKRWYFTAMPAEL